MRTSLTHRQVFVIKYDMTQAMQAMRLHGGHHNLVLDPVTLPDPSSHQILIRVQACGVCRTDLHVVDGDLPHPKLPLIPGHEIVGTVVARGTAVDRFNLHDRVGVAWLGESCGTCDFCRKGAENLCPSAKFTGYTLDGGYAPYVLADSRYCFPLDPGMDAAATAPLLCAGLIGFRALRMAGDADKIGLYGFGAAAHILMQIIRHQGRQGFAFTRPGDSAAQEFARTLGATWAGDSTASPSIPLDAALIFAPVGALVPLALRAVRPGGSVILAGIHMSDIPRFPYRLLWQERRLQSVANLTRADGELFLPLAAKIGIASRVTPYPLSQANHALADLRAGRFTGAAVLIPA